MPSLISSSATVDRENPWPGLESFNESAREFFFGREKETDELSRLVKRQTLTVLFGQSGLGKSSLLKAGLFPLLRATDHLPLYLRLDHAPGAPVLVDQVKGALKAAFAAAGADAPDFGADESLWEYFHRKDVDIWSAKNRLLTPVLAFDQFEEIFTLGRTDETCRERSREFLAELACLVENRPPATVRAKLDAGTLDPTRFNFEKPSCQVILSLREDFLPDLEGLRQDMPALIHNRLRLKKLNGAQALEVVSRPAPHLLADGVAEKIVEFVAGARGGSAERLAEIDVEPPLLSVICRELNDRRRALGHAQISADLVSGNRREILNDFYERGVADLPEEMRAFVEDHLLTKSGFRDNLALETALEFPGVTRALLDTLVARRLLRIEDRLGVQRVELTHDVLAEVIRGSRDARQQRLLLAADQRRAHRQRWIIAGLGLMVAGLLVGAYFGLRSQGRAERQASQIDVVLASRLLDERKTDEGIAYLVRAGRKDPTNPLVAPRLLSTLSSHRYLLPVAAPFDLPSPVSSWGYSADGRSLYLCGEDGMVRLIDTTSWRIAQEWSFGQKVQRRGLSVPGKNSEVFAVILADGSILVCDRATGRSRIDPIRPPEPVVVWRNGSINFELSPDGRWLAAGSATHVWVWDTTTGKLQMTRTAGPDFAFSPDSRLIATNHNRITTLWSILDQTAVGQPHESPPSDIAAIWWYQFSGDGRRLLIREDFGATICDVSTGLPVGPVVPLQRGQSIWLLHDGTKFLRGNGRSPEVVDLATLKPAYPSLALNTSIRNAIEVDEGRTLFTVSLDGTVNLFDSATGRALVEPTARQPRFTPAAVSPDGKTVVQFTPEGRVNPLRIGGRPAEPLVLPRSINTFRVNVLPGPPARLSWLVSTKQLAIDVASGQLSEGGIDFPEPVMGIARDTYGSTLGRGDIVVAVTQTKQMRIWTLGEKKVATDVLMLDPADDVTGGSPFVFDAGLQRVALALGSTKPDLDHFLAIWDATTGRRLVTINAGAGIASSNRQLALNPDGRRVAFCLNASRTVKVWDLETAREAFTVEAEDVTTCRFSADGKHLLTGDRLGGIQVWDAVSGTLLRSSQYHRAAVGRFDFSPDHRFYSSVSTDGTAQVWDAATDQPVGELREQEGAAARADFSPDSLRLATPSSGGGARVWDVATGLAVTEITEMGGGSSGVVAFTPDGRFLMANQGSGARGWVRALAVPPTGQGRTPDWLLTLATICAEKRLNEEGKLVIALDEFAKFEEVKRALATAPAEDPYALWGRWIIGDSPDRSIGPGFALTPAEAAKLAEVEPTAAGGK